MLTKNIKTLLSLSLLTIALNACGKFGENKPEPSPSPGPGDGDSNGVPLTLTKSQNVTLVLEDDSYQKIDKYFGTSTYLVVAALDRSGEIDDEIKTMISALLKTSPTKRCMPLLAVQRSNYGRDLNEIGELKKYLRALNMKPLSLSKRFGLKDASQPFVIDRNGKLVKQVKLWDDLKGICY